MSGKESPKLSKFTLLKKRKRKEVKEDPNSVANGRFQCLVANGRRRKNILFTSSHFPPQQILLYLFFPPLILRFYFTMVQNHYFMPFLPFP
jgi:hypothetical protein